MFSYVICQILRLLLFKVAKVFDKSLMKPLVFISAIFHNFAMQNGLKLKPFVSQIGIYNTH